MGVVMGVGLTADACLARICSTVGHRLAADFSQGPQAVELYGHAGDTEADFDGFENANVAAANPVVVARHLALAKRQWDKAA